MLQKPFFSIVVPTYNQAQFLGAALDSIIAQTDPDWEAIVVNDGSTDATPEVMEGYALRDPRIRIFHKSNGGVASALNEGRRQARGQWICWLSSDDMFDARKLEIHRQWIQRYPDCQFFFTYFRLLRDATGEVTDHDLWGPLPEREFQIVVLFYRNYISGISICINREAWEQVGMMDESLRYGQDFDMWLRMLAVYPGRFIPEWTCINRNHALQGSEVFPQACYFDTAKAAIRFLNHHRFEELFPLLDLNDPQAALRAVQKTFDIAAESSAFLYSLGPHPALLFRMLEWVWDAKTKRAPTFQQELEELLRTRIAQISQQQIGTTFAVFWKAVAATTQLLRPQLEYQLISPAQVGEMYYYANQSAGSAFLEPLQEYLQRYDQLQVTRYSGEPDEHEMIMLAPSEVFLSDEPHHSTFGKILKLARSLSKKGYRILLICRSRQSLGWMDGIPILGVEKYDTLKKLIPSLGPVDIWLNLSPVDSFKVKASRNVVYKLSDNGANEFVEDNGLARLIVSAPVHRDIYKTLRIHTQSLFGRLSSGLVWVKHQGFNALRRVLAIFKA